MISFQRSPDFQPTERLRLNTLIRLRWLAIVGQSITVLVVAYALNFPLPVSYCFTLIACSAWMNLFLAFRYPAAHRLTPPAAFGILVFDGFQLTGLLYLTGGLTNPFALLLTVPVVISATSLPLKLTALLSVLVMAAATLLVFIHEPLPWHENSTLVMPFVYVAGVWVAVVCSIAFTAIYAFRVAKEARQLANALAATELVLQREQHLSALDGLAAAAAHELGTPLATITLVARELQKTLGKDPKYGEDVSLLRTQSERCREILKRLTSLSSEGEPQLAQLPLTLAGRGSGCPASRLRHHHHAAPRRMHRPRTGRPAQSRRDLRARQSGRERRRFRPLFDHRALGLERSARGGVDH